MLKVSRYIEQGTTGKLASLLCNQLPTKITKMTLANLQSKNKVDETNMRHLVLIAYVCAEALWGGINWNCQVCMSCQKINKSPLIHLSWKYRVWIADTSVKKCRQHVCQGLEKSAIIRHPVTPWCLRLFKTASLIIIAAPWHCHWSTPTVLAVRTWW